eukprot:8060089-Alexandrium_andersonii.AAC.1
MWCGSCAAASPRTGPSDRPLTALLPRAGATPAVPLPRGRPRLRLLRKACLPGRVGRSARSVPPHRFGTTARDGGYTARQEAVSRGREACRRPWTLMVVSRAPSAAGASAPGST